MLLKRGTPSGPQKSSDSHARGDLRQLKRFSLNAEAADFGAEVLSSAGVNESRGSVGKIAPALPATRPVDFVPRLHFPCESRLWFPLPVRPSLQTPFDSEIKAIDSFCNKDQDHIPLLNKETLFTKQIFSKLCHHHTSSLITSNAPIVTRHRHPKVIPICSVPRTMASPQPNEIHASTPYPLRPS
ncbi:hypothetical protein CDAR_526031 [Caerostris darwini]|uniref:Uncharacterized protein n=1 Tax=Caerostris darwini TaxID=1538125 RepID=A0AAV4Q0I0_9ARAC|nr:hypothetical protein CDAR_526031 [Caerostris darwini]